MEDLDILTIRKRSIHGVLALISRTFLLNIISFGASLIVFTLLSPKEVGVYIAVLAMQRVISFLTDFGLGAALIQKKEVHESDLTTIFTIQSGVTFFIFTVIFLARNTIGNYFALTPDGIFLLNALVFSIFLSSFKIIPSLLLERKIEFHKLIVPQLLESAIFNFLLIILLLGGYGIASFGWSFIISGIIGIPAYFYISPWKVTLGISRNSLRSLRYGLQFQAKNILATIKDDLLTVILTKFLSYTDIGYIGFAQRNAFFFFRYIVDSVTKVTFSTYSRIQSEKEHLQKAIEKSLFFVSSVMFPLLSGVIITAPYIIDFFPKWNNKWEPAIVSLTFFSLNAMVSSLSNILVNVLDATGKVKYTLRLMILWTLLTWVLTPIAIHLYGYNGVAVVSFLITLTIFLTIYLVKKVVYFDFIKSIYKPLLSSLIMALFIYFAAQAFVSDFVSLIFVIISAGVVYTSCMVMIARKEIKEDIQKIFIK